MHRIWPQISAIVRRDAIIARRQPLDFALRWVSPLIGLTGFYFVARLVDPHRTLRVDGYQTGYFAYVSINLSFTIVQTSALQGVAQTIRYDQIIGTLEPILSTRAPVGLIIASCAIWPLLVSTGQVALSLIIACACMGLDLRATNCLSFLTIVALSTVTMGALGVLSAAGVIALRQVPPGSYLVGGAASLLAGSLFPVHLFPVPLQVVAWCLPLTHALRGLRGAVAGEPISRLSADALWLAVAAVVLVPIAAAVLSYAVERAKRDGSLSHY